MRVQVLLAFVTLLWSAPAARAVEIRISAKALEQTLKAQLFSTPTGRYYLRGDARTGCYAYAERPSVSFAGDRIVVHLHTAARLGKAVRGTCLGLALAPNVDVSMVPVAEGETIGFCDARIEHISQSYELNFLLTPFLNRKVPSSMKLNAATILRQLLSASAQTTGFGFTLDRLQLHSMQVRDTALVIDVDGGLSVD